MFFLKRVNNTRFILPGQISNFPLFSYIYILYNKADPLLSEHLGVAAKVENHEVLEKLIFDFMLNNA